MKVSLNAVSGGSDLSNRPDTSSIDDEDQEDGESDKSHSQSPVYSSQPPRPSTSAGVYYCTFLHYFAKLTC